MGIGVKDYFAFTKSYLSQICHPFVEGHVIIVTCECEYRQRQFDKTFHKDTGIVLRTKLSTTVPEINRTKVRCNARNALIDRVARSLIPQKG